MQKDNLTTIEGRNLVLESLKQGRNIKKIIIETGAKGTKIDSIKELARLKNVQIVVKSSLEFKKSGVSNNSQGVFAVTEGIQTYSCSSYFKNSEISANTSVVILRSLDYEHNLGAIIRTCAASNIDAVVVPKGKSSSITSTVERVSMGGVYETKIIEESFFSALKFFQSQGFKTVGLEVTGDKLFFEEDLTGNIAFVIGSESETLAEDIINKLDKVVKIPMYSNISSLNVSVSTGVVLYERIRQLSTNK